MPLINDSEDFIRRKKTKTKEKSDDNTRIVKTKTTEIPMEGNMTQVVKKTVDRPTIYGAAFGGADIRRKVKKEVTYKPTTVLESEKDKANKMAQK